MVLEPSDRSQPSFIHSKDSSPASPNVINPIQLCSTRKPQLHQVTHLFLVGAEDGQPHSQPTVCLKPACKLSWLWGLLTTSTERWQLPAPTACTAFPSPEAGLKNWGFLEGKLVPAASDDTFRETAKKVFVLETS